MKLLFQGVHGILSFSMYKDLGLALMKEGFDCYADFRVNSLFSEEEAMAAVTESGFKTEKLHSPDLVFVADPRCYVPQKCPVIEIPHGLATKAGYYSTCPEYTTDYHFSPSYWIADNMNGKFKTKFIPTGMPKLDVVVNASLFDATPKGILISPTQNIHYDCLPSIEHLLPELQKSYEVTIRPHLRTVFRDGMDRFPKGVKLDTDVTNSNSLRGADIVISDISSSWLEAMALGKRVVLLWREAAQRHASNTPDAHESVFSKYAQVIYDPKDLMAAIERAEPAPESIRERLLSYQGTAAPRCIEVIKEILNGRR